MRIISFVGLPGSGKTTASEIARDEFNVHLVKMGDVIRNEVKRRGLPLSDEFVGEVATELRETEGAAAIAKRCMASILAMKSDSVVVDGIRSEAEVDKFVEHFGKDFTLVRVDCTLDKRVERVKSRNRDDDAYVILKERDRRELGWGMRDAMSNADYVITNNGTLIELRKKVVDLFSRLLQTCHSI